MDINKIQILSESDWYFINSDNEVELYERESRNDMEIVRIFDGESFMDMPLEHPITYMPIVGGFLFDSEEVAEKYKSSLESSSGFSTVIDNSLSGSKRNDMVCVYKEIVPVENGIYCVPEFDELLSNDCWMMHVHGLTKKNEIVEPKIVGDNEHFYISKYINMLGVLGGIIPIDDENGYVTYPNVNIVTEMTNLIDASRAYEANATVFNASKSMATTGLSLASKS